jgi:hypothetical protein
MNPATFQAKAIDFLNEYIKTETEKYPASNRMWNDPHAVNIKLVWSEKDESGWKFIFTASWFTGSDDQPHHDVHVRATKRGERKTRDAWLEKDEEGHYRVV